MVKPLKIKKRLIILSLISLCLFLSTATFSSKKDHASYNKTQSENNPMTFDDNNNLKSQSLSADNTYSGIGESWNITHWANRTNYDLSTTFNEESYSLVDIPLYSGWIGYKLSANIENLYDTRNWNNGTFNFGNDDTTYDPGENDTDDIVNDFQNWTFNEVDVDSQNNMSGNYINSTVFISAGHDCLELRMDGDRYNDTGGDPRWYRYSYDENDECGWNSSIHIPRGRVIDSVIKFQVNPIHLISFNSWELTVSINSIQIYSIGIFSLKQMGTNSWHNFSIPQGLWTNTSNVYSTPFLNDADTFIEIALKYSAESAGYGFEDGENIDYQQVLIDNIELIPKAEVQPSDIKLKLNDTFVGDIEWGKGDAEIAGNWEDFNEKLYVNFSSEDKSTLGSYSIELKTDLNLYTIKNLPESNYETNVASLGTKFSVSNDSSVKWVSYSRVKVPIGYSETLMKIEFPNDINITSVYDPQNPAQNILKQCDNSTTGELSIPVNNISVTPDGFWKFEAISPNYCENLMFFNNASGSWIQKNEFLSGEYVNITAKIYNSTEISSYIQNTQSKLQIRFPNGTIWSKRDQFAFVDSSGNVNFNYFQIPTIPPTYEVGEYQAIVMWNNSYLTNGLNETGIIYKTFKVIHESKLTPEKHFYEDNFENSTVNLKVTFNDLKSNLAIEGAKIYTYNLDIPSVMQNFSEISPGYYFLEFNINGADYGNNTIKIYANSTYYVNKIIDITIELINRTNLIVNKDFFEGIQYQTNFTVQFDYIDNNTGLTIDPSTISTDWGGDYHFVKISKGTYNLTCNASGHGYIAGKLYTFNINVDAFKYEAQTVQIKVFITELDSTINLKLDGAPTEPNTVLVIGVWEQMNITIQYRDILGKHLSNASVNITGKEFTKNLEEDSSFEQYSIILNAIDLARGLDNLIITAYKINYEPCSIPFIIEIIESQTNYQILINGVNKTKDPSVDIRISQFVNITIKYYDFLGNHIPNAFVHLTGDYTANLVENESLEQYSIIIDTNDLDIGVKLLTISSYRPNYEFQSDVIRIQVKRIRTEIISVSGDSVFHMKPGEEITLRVRLLNLDLNNSIIGVSVNYSWVFGNGTLLDPENDGIYEVTIPGLPLGSYDIIIIAYLSDDYDVQSYKITLIVTKPSDNIFFFQIGIIIGIVAASIVGGYMVLYWRIFRFPKVVRKIRKFRRTLRQKKAPKIEINSREKGFNLKYNEELSKTSKFLHGKPSKQRIDLKKSPEKEIKPTSNMPINEKGGGA